MPGNTPSKNRFIFIGLFLLLAIFTSDLLTPLAIADEILYLAVMLLAMQTNDRRLVIITGIASILLIVAGYIFSPPHVTAEPYFFVINRVLSILIVIIGTFVMISRLNDKESLSAHIKELENTNKELESFNYVSSHDLQEPLRKIKNFASLLTEEKNLSDDGKYYLQRMYESSKQMQLLIEDLLSYSRIRNAAVSFEKTEINKIVEEVTANYKEAIHEKKAIIQTEGDCHADLIRFQFRQLLSNLISNSLKFSHPDRQLQVVIKSESAYGSELKPKLSPAIKYCHISITDNGIGFDPQYNERIFNIFERLNGREKYSGTGIGLAICKRIVENHKGIITASGELNIGARFDIYIPAG